MKNKGIKVLEILFPFAFAAGIACTDAYIKNRLEEELPEEDEFEGEKKGFLILRRHHNTGAFMGSFKKYDKEVRGVSIFATALAFFALMFSLTKRGRLLEKAGLTFILGGAASNTYDRVKKGYVMDYASLDVKPKKIRNVVFNISDVSIFTGSLLVLISNIFSKDRMI